MIKQAMKTNIFKYVPRISKADNKIELFFIDEHLDLNCYAEIGEHSGACREYYLNETKPVPNERQSEAIKFFERYLSTYKDENGCKSVLKKRLSPPTYNLYHNKDYYKQKAS